jgi:hypothetical protein
MHDLVYSDTGSCDVDYKRTTIRYLRRCSTASKCFETEAVTADLLQTYFPVTATLLEENADALGTAGSESPENI